MHLPVAIGDPTGAVAPALVVDLSLAGACLELSASAAPGERIRLTLDTPLTWDPVVLEAIVVWIAGDGGQANAHAPDRPSRAGVRFDYKKPAAVLAMFETLTGLAYE